MENKSFEYKNEHSFSSTIRQVVEIDALNGLYGVVMDGGDGIFVLRIDFITGDFKITVK
jgi:hypothetical protein